MDRAASTQHSSQPPTAGALQRAVHAKQDERVTCVGPAGTSQGLPRTCEIEARV